MFNPMLIQAIEASESPPSSPKGGLDLLSLFKISKLLKKGATAIVLKAVAVDHEEMDRTPFVLRLKDDDCPPDLIRNSQIVNYRLALGQRDSLRGYSGDSVIKDALIARIDDAVELLRNDLAVRITAKSGQSATGLAPEEIAAITPLDSLPEIENEASLAGLLILSVGSGFGSAIQARRQLRNFGLSSHQGAQYLNSFGTLKEQLPNLRAKNAQIDLLLSNEEAITTASVYVARTMNRLTKEFKELLTEPSKSTPRNPVYKALGFGFLGLAIAGYSLPVMPGTIFLICSAYCFSRSSTKMSQWLNEHPKFGPILDSWNQDKSIPKLGKILATTSIAVSSLAVGFSSMPYKPVAIIFLIGSAAYILSRPTSRDKK